MKVIDVLKCASLYLNLEKEFDIFFNPTEEVPSEETKSEYQKLLQAFNLMVRKISSDYIPVLKSETVEALDNKIYFSDLSMQANQIYKVIAPSGKNLRYKIFDEYLKINFNGFVTIEYSFHPEEFSDTDDFNLFFGKLSLFSMAMGVAGEYSFINGFFDDAKIWEARFKEGLRASIRKRSFIKMPKRRWY